MSKDHFNTLIKHGEDIIITPQQLDEIVACLNYHKTMMEHGKWYVGRTQDIELINAILETLK